MFSKREHWICVVGLLSIVLPSKSALAAISLTDPFNEDHSVSFTTLGVENPQFSFDGVPVYGDLTISFGTHFVGQVFGGTDNSLVDTSPMGGLALSMSGSSVETLFDFASPNGVALGGTDGSTFFTTPLAILFDNPVSKVSIALGHLDVDSPTQVEAFDQQGNSLGVVSTATASGRQQLSISDSSGTNIIAGLSIYVPNGEMDWEGFGLNDIAFAVQDDDGVIPEPSTIVVWSVLGSLGLCAVWLRHRRSTR